MKARAFVALAGVVAGLAGLAGAGCGGGRGGDPRFPEQPKGCEVKLFRESPSMSVDNIGPVNARCDDTVSDADCERTLKDAVCRLGGDVVWGVGNPTKDEAGKNRWSGRAAHARGGASAGAAK